MAKKSEALVKTGKTDLTKLEPWEQELANEATNEASKETLGVPRITHKGGILKYNEKKVPNNEILVATIDYAHTKAYYEDEFEEGKPQTPVCYASGKDEATLVPHVQAPKKQSDTCSTCPHNQFGTALKGRGKRCKDERRLMVVAPTNNEVETLQKVDVAQISVPPDSLKFFAKYLKSDALNELTPLGIRGVITKIKPEPSESGGHNITFEAMEALPKKAVQALIARRPSVQDALLGPYPVIKSDDEPEQTEAEKAKAAKLRKKVQ